MIIGNIYTLSSSSALLTICFVDSRNENLSSRKFIALSNAFMNCKGPEEREKDGVKTYHMETTIEIYSSVNGNVVHINYDMYHARHSILLQLIT